MMVLGFARTRLMDLMGASLPRAALIGCAGLMTAALGGFYFGAPKELPEGTAALEPWKLPDWAQPEPARDVQTIEARHPWGVSANSSGPANSSGGAQSQAALSFRIAGTIAHGDKSVAVVIGGGDGKVDARELGAILPDGQRIVAIGPTQVTLEKDGVKTTRRLFHLGPSAGEKNPGEKSNSGD